MLKQNGTGLWDTVAEVAAVTAPRAQRDAVSNHGEGTYVAVPVRSWKPTRFQTETLTRVKAQQPQAVAA